MTIKWYILFIIVMPPWSIMVPYSLQVPCEDPSSLLLLRDFNSGEYLTLCVLVLREGDVYGAIHTVSWWYWEQDCLGLASRCGDCGAVGFAAFPACYFVYSWMGSRYMYRWFVQGETQAWSGPQNGVWDWLGAGNEEKRRRHLEKYYFRSHNFVMK